MPDARPPRDLLALLGLPADARVEPAAGGASGAAWRVRVGARTYVMRRSAGAELTDARLAAMTAAHDAGLPAPKLVARTDAAVLLTWLPGRRMIDALAASPGAAAVWGRRSGELQRTLHQVIAPAAVCSVLDDVGHPFGAGRDVPGAPDGDRLLHLDWHPLNLLVDDARGEICGIVDWDNARRGSPLLDVARTDAILTLEPSLADLAAPVRRALPDFLAGWRDGYGEAAADIPLPCRRWAARVMVADLEPRYADRPTVLDPSEPLPSTDTGRPAACRLLNGGPWPPSRIAAGLGTA